MITAETGRDAEVAAFVAARTGSQVHDPIRYDPAKHNTPNFGFVRDTNNAGGTEGGMSTGEVLRVRAAMKPIATVPRALRTAGIARRRKATSWSSRRSAATASSA